MIPDVSKDTDDELIAHKNTLVSWLALNNTAERGYINALFILYEVAREEERRRFHLRK